MPLGGNFTSILPFDDLSQIKLRVERILEESVSVVEQMRSAIGRIRATMVLTRLEREPLRKDLLISGNAH